MYVWEEACYVQCPNIYMYKYMCTVLIIVATLSNPAYSKKQIHRFTKSLLGLTYYQHTEIVLSIHL